jgi:uncharacterized protein (DUF1330 family)
MPKGYIFAELEVIDPAGYEEYRRQVPAVVAAYGGRYLVRGGDPVVLEGDARIPRMVLLEFDSPERALAWYNSPEYQAILPIRLGASKGRAMCLTAPPA